MAKKGVLLLLLLAWAFGGCKPEEPPRPKEGGGRTVKVVKAEVREIRDVVEFVANLEALRQALVIPKVSGVIERLRVREGDRVREGEVLFELEKGDFLLAVRQAEAALKEAEAAHEQASRDFSRFEALRGKQVISQREYEQARVQRDLALARLEQARVALEQARRNLEETVIRAPFAGVVTQRFKDEGERVRAGMPGQEAAVLLLEDLSVLKARGSLPELEVGQVREGMEAEVRVDAYPQEVFRGKVSLVSPRLDPASRAFTVEVEIPNAKGLLKPGMFARVRILKGTKRALVVPLEAVLREEGVWVYHCFVVKDGRAERRTVVPRFTPFDYVEILEGLEEGELVVVGGQWALRGGEEVVVEDEAP